MYGILTVETVDSEIDLPFATTLRLCKIHITVAQEPEEAHPTRYIVQTDSDWIRKLQKEIVDIVSQFSGQVEEGKCRRVELHAPAVGNARRRGRDLPQFIEHLDEETGFKVKSRQAVSKERSGVYVSFWWTR